MSENAPITYTSAGVDVEAGDRAVELMKASVRTAQRPEVLGGLGGFAGMFDASAWKNLNRPILATSTDGVGTKVDIARATGKLDTVGIDLVGMVVDDIVVCGAEPLFMTDYIACGHVEPTRIAAIVSGIAEGCRRAGVALIGGETAEHPGLMEADEFDIAGAATGVVDYENILTPERVRAGDSVIALAASGLHSNGYSLVRAVMNAAGWTYGRHVEEFGRTLGEELLEPTRIYTKLLLDAIRAPGADVHALSHVTGGGLAANLARVLPAGLTAVIDRTTWTPPAVFHVVQTLGRVPSEDIERTLNMGVGFVAVVAAGTEDAVLGPAAAAGVEAWHVGQVFEDAAAPTGAGIDRPVQGAKGVNGGSVAMSGTHPGA